MLTKESLEKENIRLKTLIEKKAAEIGCAGKILYDGVAYPEKYAACSPRIMWILKESYETHDCYGWHVGEIYHPLSQTRKQGTIWQVSRVSYGLLHNSDYAAVCKASDDELDEARRHIAWINLSKIAAKKTSPQDLTPQYTIWKDVLQEQLEAYQPQVIIGGNTLKYFKDNTYIDFQAEGGEKKVLGIGTHHYHCFPDRLFINACHPGKPMLNGKEYYTKICNAYNDWVNGKKER